MNSSTSNSEAGQERPVGSAWRRFFQLAIGTALGVGVFVYGFVVIVDPWGVLPLSPAFDRVPVSSNARFSFPALARSPSFDSAIIGTSTSRLLRPQVLNPALGVSFANLAMNSATPYEQSRMLEVFTRAHSQARIVMIGIDGWWCRQSDTYEKYTPRPFPEWMYEPNPWIAYRQMFNLFAVQEAWNQFAILTGMKKPRYGKDGYTNFLPDESRYDIARVRPKLSRQDDPPPRPAMVDRAALWFPAHPFMETALHALPAATRKILFFVPYYIGIQPPAGSHAAAVLDECKARIVRIAAGVPNATVVDFMIPSPITQEETHYWDPQHYRVPIADRLMAGLIDVAKGVPDPPGGDDRVLLEGHAAQ
jgi:hypothetical protein